MPTPIAYPLVNGVRHGFASIELRLWKPGSTVQSPIPTGINFVGFKAINYKRTRTREKVRGAHPDPIAKTRGDNDYDGDCELYLAEWNLWQASLGKGYGDVFGAVYVTYGESQFDTIQDVLQGCTVDSTEASQSQGPGALTRKVDLGPLKILFNGIDDLANPLVAPAGS